MATSGLQMVFDPTVAFTIVSMLLSIIVRGLKSKEAEVRFVGVVVLGSPEEWGLSK